VIESLSDVSSWEKWTIKLGSNELVYLPEETAK
jgi:hypothetical protein